METSSPHNRQTSQLLEVQRRMLAEAVVARQYERHPELRQRYGEGSRAKCVQDTEYHLSYLATAITYSSPTLFTEYISWVKAVLTAFGVGIDDIQLNLECLREVLLEQLPEDHARNAAEFVDAGLRVLPAAVTEVPSFIDGNNSLAELARAYLQALLRGQRHEASRLVLGAAREGIELRDIYLQVFQCCQREVGRLWQLKRITVAQEHYCTAATQLVMSQLYPYLFAVPKNRFKMAAASVGGELHEVGLRIVTDLFEAHGWNTLYLGANQPMSGVVQAIEEHRPNLLVVSVTMTFHLPAMERLIAAVRASQAGSTIKVMAGGYPFNLDPDLWQRVGADGHATDASEALKVAARLLNIKDGTGQPPPREWSPGKLAELVGGRESGETPSEIPAYDELSRLNSELVTAQRELARKNAELERLNERLREADQRKDEFLAMLAHELRNPLAPLRNAAYLLQQPGLDQPAVELTGEMMGRQVQQLGRLVDDLLDLSRIARGKMQLRKEWVDLVEATRRAAESCRPLVESKQHKLILSLPTSSMRVLADPTRLEQILTNLLNNAARYTPEQGQIYLTVSQSAGKAVVRVRDTGIGIPPEMLSRIFGMFSQVGRAEERAGGGLGIGLSLVKSLTEMHGGSVEAQSAGPGQGSEFTVRWPMPLAEKETRRPAIAEPQVAEKGRRVLLVDDSLDAAQSLSMLLRLWGHKAVIANDGPSALRLVEQQTPDFALLDIGLPGMDGYELARQLRQRPELNKTVLVALTGWGQDEDRRRSQEAGFDHHLVKPVELSALQKILAQAQHVPRAI